MSSLNKTILLGRLGQSPELRHTQSQVPVTSLNVATTEVYKDKDGNKVEDTEWHRVVVWKKNAENCVKYLVKGQEVLIEGRLKTRSWEDQGQKKFVTEVVADRVDFGAKPAGTTGTTQQAPTAQGIPEPQPVAQPVAAEPLPTIPF